MAELSGPFGKYYLCEKLASGGMAEIYLAKLLGPGGFEKQLVIKQISPELGRERAFVDLFVAEAKTLVSLSHGNIVPVYELGVVDDTYFIAMEYVDGPTLSELLRTLDKRGQVLDPPMAAYVAGELLKGLDYAHRKADGVIHRDLSPRNVLVSRDGEVKLVDFGLAVAAGSVMRGREGRPAGSFPYMSPEQVRQEQLDGRSDLFSAGVLLWEMLTGHYLFARDDDDATLAAVLDAEIPAPSAVRAGVPAELDRICLLLLARDREARWGSAGEVVAALTRFAYSLEPPVTASALAAVVARTCPPIKRSERPASEVDLAEPGSVDLLLRTRPMALRQRPATVRTIAAHEEFQEVLSRATPMMPIDALSDLPEGATEPSAEPAAEPPPPPEVRSSPPRRRRALALGVVGLAAAGAAAIAFAARGDDGERTAADRAQDAAPRVAAAAPTRPDAAPPPPDAAPPPPDAGPGRSKQPKNPPPPRGTGSLTVGANPWADVLVDGKKLGEAPGTFSVSAGPHTVELRHGDKSKSFKVEIDPGESENLGLVDFTRD